MKSKVFSPIISSSIATGIAFISIVIFVPAASAGIKCNGEFQVIKGEGFLATPWCEDQYLSRIARQYGWKVSDSMMRENPNLKEEVCRFIGHDSRIKAICNGHGSFDETDNSQNGTS